MRVVLACLMAIALQAAPVGNTAAPQILQKGLFIPGECWINLRLGYEGDFVFDANLNSVDRYSQTTNSGTATLNILERLDLYGVFGSSQSCAQWRFSDAADNIHNVEMETAHAFLWGFGARAILLQWNKWDLGIGGRYSSVNNPLSWLTIDGSNASTQGAHARWRQWQVNADISYHIDLFTPYIGIKYGIDKSFIDTSAITEHFESKCPVGLDLGCALSTGKYFMLNLEARLISEEALTVSGDIRF